MSNLEHEPLPAVTGAANRVLVVEDDPMLAQLMSRWLVDGGYQVEIAASGSAALAAASAHSYDAVCLDLGLPDLDGLEVLKRFHRLYAALPVIILTADDRVDTAVAATRLGAFDYAVKPVSRDRLTTLLRNASERSLLARRLEDLERAGDIPSRYGIVGASAPMENLFARIDRVSTSDVTVAVRGESGSGKELVARAIHRASGRSRQPFVALNCAAIAESLQESELFGHEKGAFTGAHARRVGRFEEADGGTLFLDEVAELSLPLQAKLLRVLQERQFSRVGAHQVINSDFRLVTATHKNLRDEVDAGRFREDLYYRIAVFELEIPPLRRRLDDIPLLAARMLTQIGTARGGSALRLSASALTAMEGYAWPGNVRELQNALQHASVVAAGDSIEATDLPHRVVERQPADPAPPAPTTPSADMDVAAAPPPVVADLRGPTPSAPAAPQEEAPVPEASPRPSLPTLNLKELERLAIIEALERHPSNVSAAIRELGLGRTTMYRKLRELGLRE